MSPAAPRQYPQSPVFYRALDKPFPKVVQGEGCWLTDDAGKRYLDACGGAFAANVGHGVREIAQAIGEQAAKVAYVNGTAFTSAPAEELAAELAALAPQGLDKTYFLSSGSEAVEAALKLARQYWVETGKPGKHKIISRTPGYHGNTLLALSVSARAHYKKLYGPWLVDCPMIPAPYAYRCACGGAAATPSSAPSGDALAAEGAGAADCPACSGRALEAALIKEGPETVAAFIAEPVGGSSTGASVPRLDYYRAIRDICDRHDVLFIADEVLTGAGRTGRWLAMEHFPGVLPDIVTMGKGISGGYVPLSAVLAGRKILDPIAKGTGAFKHAQTFSHMPTICAAGLAAVRYIKKNALVERAAKTGAILQKKLAALAELPGVGDARGLGMLAGIEFVADKKTKKPFPRSLKFAETFTARAQEAGLIVWPNVGQADGENGDLAMIAPPFIITEAELDELVARFKTALTKTLESVSAKGGIK